MDTLFDELWPLIITDDWQVYRSLLAIPKFARLVMSNPVKWRRFLTIEVKYDNCVIWTLAGRTHRDDDLPATIYVDGGQFWYHHGKCHRDSDLPAIIFADDSRWWYHLANSTEVGVFLRLFTIMVVSGGTNAANSTEMVINQQLSMAMVANIGTNTACFTEMEIYLQLFTLMVVRRGINMVNVTEMGIFLQLSTLMVVGIGIIMVSNMSRISNIRHSRFDGLIFFCYP